MVLVSPFDVDHECRRRVHDSKLHANQRYDRFRYRIGNSITFLSDASLASEERSEPPAMEHYESKRNQIRERRIAHRVSDAFQLISIRSLPLDTTASSSRTETTSCWHEAEDQSLISN